MDLRDIYRKILTIRGFENKLDDLFKRGLVHGTAHLCIGQEFCPAIVSQYLTKDDTVTSTHRGHGHALAKGLDFKTFLAELLGKDAGYCGGRGGTQHVVSDEHNFFANGITGGMVPVAAGMAFANKYKKNNDIVVAFFGDGAFCEGYVLEALNLAAVLKLPVLFVCENNHFAMSTHIKHTHSSQIKDKVEAFGIECEAIDNNDYIKLDKVAKEYIAQIRSVSRPRFIEVRTYRHSGHSKNDLNLYRDKEEEKHWFDHDVVKKIEENLMKSGVTAAELDTIRKKIEREINNIADEVVKLPDSDADTVLHHVFQ